MYTFIFDIGKTNIKAVVLDERGRPVWSRSSPNASIEGEEYLQFDIDGIWRWLLQGLKDVTGEFAISAINISTHGACAALLDGAGGLAFPVMDYEYEGLVVAGADYRDVRPPFAQTFSPELASGLNLGRQLWWLKSRFPDRFERVSTVLMYPQFWAWKLTGIAVTEVTSLGCHTDLWDTSAGRYSPLVDTLGIEQALPGLVSATAPVGAISFGLARTLGLSQDCQVYPGVHDSNASFARYLYCGPGDPFTMVSTGTWIVSMCSGGSLDALSESRDMLANVSVLNQPIACARFMGGREFDEICRRSPASAKQTFAEADIEQLVSHGTFALPSFESGSGPFRKNPSASGRVVGGQGSPALATLYIALVLDFELDLLQARGNVIFGSISSKNPLLCGLLAQLRPAQTFLSSYDAAASTITGAWCLTRWGKPVPLGFDEFGTVVRTDVADLADYRAQWRAQIDSGSEVCLGLE